MSKWLAGSILLFFLTACTATPELTFDGDDASVASPNDGAAPGDGSRPTGDANGQSDGAITNDAAGPNDAGPSDATPPGDAAPAPDASALDVSAPNDASGGSDTSPPVDSGPPDSAPPDASSTCTPNLPAGLDCCPNGDPCTGIACQHCADCTGCAAPNVCCAVVNGGGKYKSMKCSASPVGCP